MITDDLAYKLHALVYSIDNEAAKVLKASSRVNYSQFLMILCFYQNSGQTQKFAAHWLQLTEATVSHTVKNLAKSDLLKISKDPQDSRVHHIYPTKSGTQIIKSVYPLLVKMMAEHYKSLGKKNVELFSSMIDELNKSINKGEKCE